MNAPQPLSSIVAMLGRLHGLRLSGLALSESIIGDAGNGAPLTVATERQYVLPADALAGALVAAAARWAFAQLQAGAMPASLLHRLQTEANVMREIYAIVDSTPEDRVLVGERPSRSAAECYADGIAFACRAYNSPRQMQTLEQMRKGLAEQGLVRVIHSPDASALH